MNKKKFLKVFLTLLILIIGMCFLRMINLKQIWEVIRDFNLDLSENNAIGLFLVYWFEIITILAFLIIKLPALVALTVTAITLNWYSLNDIQKILRSLRDFEFDFWETIKMISPLTMVVLLVFIWYFTSHRGSIRRAVAQANRKKMEDIVQKQRDLLEAVEEFIYSIALNLKYVINCQELVADLWIHSQFPDYKNERHRAWRDFNVESYPFKDIPSLEVISKKFDELNLNENRSASRYFFSYKYEFLTFMTESSQLNKKSLNEKNFTKEGINS